MNRRNGMEGSYGIGGGIVSEESRKNLEKGEELCRKKKPNEAFPYLMKAIELDRNNLDAYIEISFLLDWEGAVETLEAAELRGRQILKQELGINCFIDDGGCVGKFWMMLQTRPYMRVLRAQVRVYIETRKFDRCAKTLIEMLRLCPGDNLGQRFSLGSVLIHCGRYADALSFSQQWLDNKGDVGDGCPPRGGTVFKAPRRDPGKPRSESELRWESSQILYTAALASFKLFGDCHTSQAYLKMSAISNPHILVKILARVQKPATLNSGARAANGPEDAQDYLWLTQDLWMKDDVWNWANNNVDAKNTVLKVCSRESCGAKEKEVAEYKRCSACHLVSYCGPACQKQDWPKHKPACLDHKMQKATMRAFQHGKPSPKGSPFPFFSTDIIQLPPP
ncbi:hypothetical protein M413DRAFT_143938 [Hebeloma cylindrosporum]|uniref:MYND-type domain-containing protein n=1 Tax=Hebeloma cylindrosporum TaxID=76867 RepID=A0A0C2YM49_HEBCY|nr:hypothetical protein M413DRAFT_143938 [Hebeloma cylindrosporum h7]